MKALPETMRTKFRQSAEVLSLIEAFENCTLPLSKWNRETYLTLVFWYLYLNPFVEAEQLMQRSLKRYQFENGLNLMQPASLGKIRSPHLFQTINSFIKIHKGEKTFVELANLVLEIKELR